MGKLIAFTFISLDGYFKGNNEDISWHQHAEDDGGFSAENANSGNILLFGRKTYEMMAGFWPTSMASDHFPEVAKGMNKAEKFVFSRTLKKADWAPTKIISDNIPEEVMRLKQTPGKDLTLLGSGSILTQLATANLVDEYQLMVDPVVLGSGTSIFKDLKSQPKLQLTATRTFKSGAVLLCYRPE